MKFFLCCFTKCFTFFEKSRRKDKDLCTITELFAKLKDFYRWLPIRSCSFVKKGRRAEIFYKTKQIAFIFSTLTETSFLERQLEFIPLSLTFLIEFLFLIVNFQIQFRNSGDWACPILPYSSVSIFSSSRDNFQKHKQILLFFI